MIQDEWRKKKKKVISKTDNEPVPEEETPASEANDVQMDVISDVEPDVE